MLCRRTFYMLTMFCKKGGPNAQILHWAHLFFIFLYYEVYVLQKQVTGNKAINLFIILVFVNNFSYRMYFLLIISG